MMRRYFQLNALRRRARAAVAVEFAVILPVLITILFGIIEFGWLFTVRSTMVNAAREGARLGALEGVSDSEISARTQQYLVPMHLDGRCTINITDPTTADPTVTVRVSAPRASVSLLGNFFGWTTGTIEGQASMRREGM